MPAPKLPTRRLILTLASVAVAAAACGSSAKGVTSATTPTTASNSGSSTSSAATPTPVGPGSNSGSGATNFCDLVRNDEAAFNPYRDLATMKPTNLKSLYSKLGPALQQAQEAAPSAIKGDFATFVTFFQQLNSALAAAQYDVANLDLTSFADLNTAKVKTATADISRYVTQACHIGVPPTTTT